MLEQASTPASAVGNSTAMDELIFRVWLDIIIPPKSKNNLKASKSKLNQLPCPW